MTPSRLAEIKALADAATDGPWGYTYDGSGDYTVGLAKDPQGDGNTIASLYGPVETGNDAAFIAASRTAVPELVAEVERNHRLFSEIAGNIGAPRNAIPENLPAEVAMLVDGLQRKCAGLSADMAEAERETYEQVCAVDATATVRYNALVAKNHALRAEVARLTALLARPRCRWLTGALQCLLDEGHEGECRMSKTPDPGLVNHEHMPIEWMV